MKSFLEGRAVVSRNGQPAERPSGSQLPSLSRVPGDSGAATITPYAGQREHGEKKIETVEVDGVVQKIIVTCGCGEKIEVFCAY